MKNKLIRTIVGVAIGLGLLSAMLPTITTASADVYGTVNGVQYATQAAFFAALAAAYAAGGPVVASATTPYGTIGVTAGKHSGNAQVPDTSAIVAGNAANAVAPVSPDTNPGTNPGAGTTSSN